MTEPTNPERPHWLHYTLQFKDPVLERATATGVPEHRLTQNHILTLHSEDIPSILKDSNTIRKVVAVLLWIVGLGIFTAIAMMLSSSFNKTKEYIIIMQGQREDASIDAFNQMKSRSKKVDIAISKLLNRPLASPAPPALTPAVDSQTLLSAISNAPSVPISPLVLEQLGDLAFDTYACIERGRLTQTFGTHPPSSEEVTKKDQNVRLLTSPPFNTEGTLKNIASSLENISTSMGLTLDDRKKYVKITSNLLYLCEVIKNSIRSNPTSTVATHIGDLEHSLLASIHSFSLGLQTDNIDHYSTNQENFESQDPRCRKGDANSSCGGIAIAAILDSSNAIADGFSIHRHIKGAGKLIDYASIGELRNLPGVESIQSKEEDPINKAVPLIDRYKKMLDTINNDTKGILQVGGLYLAFIKNPEGLITIYDSHGSQSARKSETGNQNAYSAQFPDANAASLFLAANIRPNFEVDENNAISIHTITFKEGITAENVTEDIADDDFISVEGSDEDSDEDDNEFMDI